MLYGLIGSILLGAASTLYQLWRKSGVETDLAKTKGQLESAQGQISGLTQELNSRAAIYKDELARRDDQITLLRKERDEALDKLVKAGAPGSITDLIRLHEVPQTGDPKKPTA
jgi:hypothetical protein